MRTATLGKPREAGVRSRRQLELLKRRAQVEVPLLSDSTSKLLNAFWTARGVHEASDRAKLVDIATHMVVPDDASVATTPADALTPATALPGVETLWELDMDTAPAQLAVQRVAQVSQRLVELAQVLGAAQGDIDVVFMVVREPALLCASLSGIADRMVQLRIALAGRLDVARLVERHPALLLEQTHISQQNVEEALQSWLHGLPSDTAEEWLLRIEELQAYRREHGDVHVGFRDSDDLRLKRWCRKQRTSFERGLLTQQQAQALNEVGFEFCDEEAEWQARFTDLKQFRLRNGHIDSSPFTATADFHLTNWCSVQRIARRSSVLSQERVQLLDTIAFDWAGADPLS